MNPSFSAMSDGSTSPGPEADSVIITRTLDEMTCVCALPVSRRNASFVRRSAAAKCDSGANFASSTACMAAQLLVKPAPHGLQSMRGCNGESQQHPRSKERDLSRWLPKRCTFLMAAMAFSSYPCFHASTDRLTRVKPPQSPGTCSPGASSRWPGMQPERRSAEQQHSAATSRLDARKWKLTSQMSVRNRSWQKVITTSRQALQVVPAMTWLASRQLRHCGTFVLLCCMEQRRQACMLRDP